MAMADGDYLECTANPAPGDNALGGLLADLLNQWEDEDEVPLEAQDQDQATVDCSEQQAAAQPESMGMHPVPAIESTLARLSEATALEASEASLDPIAPSPPGIVKDGFAPVDLDTAEADWREEPESPVAATELVSDFAAAGEEPAPEPETARKLALAARTRAQRNEGLLELVRSMYQGIQQRGSGGGVAGKDGFVVVRLGGQQYGISIRRVLEAGRMPLVTTVPLAPAFVPGVINLRGEVLPLVDLRLLMGLDSTSSGRMVIIRSKDGAGGTAIVVDGLAGIAWLDRTLLACSNPVPNGQTGGIRLEDLVSATGLHRDRQLGILDLDRLFGSKELAELV
ncbi:MAG: chemotaxis protein CheW [Acidobacteriia bacterium]|nr:chemotaxis protein CheW [Terriglobia bacterium]